MNGKPLLGPGGVARQIARGVLGAVSPRLLEQVQLARVRARYRHEPVAGPRRLLLEVTTACNYHCLMCPHHSPLTSFPIPAKVMPWETIQRLLCEAVGMGAQEAWFAGRGEPLLHPHMVQIVALGASLGLKTMITTNGSKLTDALADELCATGLGQLSVSLNSGNAETYARMHGVTAGERARVLAVLERMSRRPDHPHLSATMVLLRPNAHETVQFVTDAIQAGVNVVSILGLRCEGLFPTLVVNDTEELRRELEAARALARQAGVCMELHNLPQASGVEGAIEPLHWNLGCFVGYQFTRIDVDGNLEGCCACANQLGNLAETSFPAAWRSRAYQEFREHGRRMPETRQSPPGCDCADCGNAADNDAAYREMGLLPIQGRGRRPRRDQ